MPYATLPERGLIVLKGEETLTFLQGLVSNDVLRLPEAGIIYTALLTPQGKFLHDFFVVSYAGFVLIDCEKARLEELRKRFSMYKLRSKVTIEVAPEAMGVAVLWNEPPPTVSGTMAAFPDPRMPALGWRIYGEKALLDEASALASAADYDLHRLRLGIPEGGKDMIPEKSFLLPFGFEDLHGVDFKKGCYIGQEVTARSKHLGQVRKFIYKVEAGQNALPAAGTPIYYAETLAGELRSSQGGTGLALMSVEYIEKSREAGKPFLCNNQIINVALPGWVKKPIGTMA